MANTEPDSNTQKRLLSWVKRLLLLSLLLAGLWWLLTSSGQTSNSDISSKDVTTARKLLSSTLRQLSQADDRIELSFEQAQLDALMNVASYTVAPLQFNGVISNFGVAVRADWQFSQQRRVSAYCLFLPGNDGFAIDHCRLGKIPLPGAVANAMLSAAVKTMLAAPADHAKAKAFVEKMRQQDPERVKFVEQTLRDEQPKPPATQQATTPPAGKPGGSD